VVSDRWDGPAIDAEDAPGVGACAEGSGGICRRLMAACKDDSLGNERDMTVGSSGLTEPSGFSDDRRSEGMRRLTGNCERGSRLGFGGGG
jgi:hypothetical protein